MTGLIANPRHSFRWKLGALVALTGLADFLFYDQLVGWTLGLFGLLLTAAVLLFNPGLSRRPETPVVLALTLGQCVLLTDRSNPLSILLLVAGLVSLAVLARGGWGRDARLWAGRLAIFWLWLLRPLLKACVGWQRCRARHPRVNGVARVVRGWFLTVVLSVVFVALFTAANPIVTRWVESIDLGGLGRLLFPPRMLFWLAVFCLCLAVVRPRIKRLNIWRAAPAPEPVAEAPEGLLEWAFTRGSVLRALIAFNLLFALQTAMDLAYLWGGRSLPEGITYAEYAHKGAYPLIATALLAGVFALIAQEAGPEVSRSRAVRGLLYAWVGQNVLLVVSSIYRTDLYVEIYALTYLRVAAFIWMGLVAAGLCWIVLRGILGKSSLWLLNANALTLLAVLNAVSFADIGGLAAGYNVMHCKEVTGTGVALDYPYLLEIGRPALPALRAYAGHLETADAARRAMVLADIKAVEDGIARDMANWRGWTYSGHRLLRNSGEFDQ
jgi:hypothetical protein